MSPRSPTSPSSAAPASTPSSSDAEEHAVTTPYGDPSAPVAVGDGGRPAGGVPAAARQAPRLPAAPRSTTAPTSGRCARSASARCWRRARSAGCRRRGGAGRPRRAGPARRPHQRPGVVVRRARRGAPAVRRPLLPAGLRRAGRRGARRAARRDDGGHRGAAVLHPRRVAVVRRPGLDADQHDRRSRGGARPRAADVLRRARAGHRHGRRRRGRARASARRRCSRCSGRTSSGSPGCSPPRSRRCPTPTAAPARPGPTASS